VERETPLLLAFRCVTYVFKGACSAKKRKSGCSYKDRDRGVAIAMLVMPLLLHCLDSILHVCFHGVDYVLPFCSASMLHYVCIYDQLIGHYTWFLVHVTRSLSHGLTDDSNSCSFTASNVLASDVIACTQCSIVECGRTCDKAV
jgi:hypothetical protein